MQLFELCRVLDKNYRQKANARNSAVGADLGVRFFRRLRQVHCFAGSIAALSVYNWTTFARAQPLRRKHDKKLGRTNMAPRHFLKLADFTATDVYGVKYNVLSDARVASHSVRLADDNAKEYLALDVTSFDNANSVVTISKKSSSTAIVTPPVCTVQLVVVDQWGKTTTADITVKVTK